MNILGISCYFHDASAALLQDGRLIAAAEEERFTRKKHDYEFPQHAIDFCLKAGGIEAAELDYVAFFEKPFIKFERLLLSSMQTFPRSHRVFREAMITWLGDKLWIKTLIQKRLGVPASKILFSEHHLSHAASAFLCSPFEEAGILTVDGVGEWATASMGMGKGTDVKLLKEIRFPHSLGLLYSAFTAFLGFEVNEGEYKVMGMAPFGKPKYLEKVYKLIRVSKDSSFELDMNYFSFHHSPDQTFNARFVDLFGPPRDPKALFFTPATGYPSYFGDKPDELITSLAKRTSTTRISRQVYKPSLKRSCSAWLDKFTKSSASSGSAWQEGWLSIALRMEELCVKHQLRSCISSLRPATVAAPSGPHSIPITPFWASHGNS